MSEYIGFLTRVKLTNIRQLVFNAFGDSRSGSKMCMKSVKITHLLSLNANARLITRGRDHASTTPTPTVCPSESASSSMWHVWFASRCPGRRLSTWQMIAASCQTALGALCGQLTFTLAWCREHSTVTATTFAVAGPRLWNSSSPAVQSRRHLQTFFSRSVNTVLCGLIYGALEKHLLTYLLTIRVLSSSECTKTRFRPGPRWLSLRRLPRPRSRLERETSPHHSHPLYAFGVSLSAPPVCAV